MRRLTITIVESSASQNRRSLGTDVEGADKFCTATAAAHG